MQKFKFKFLAMHKGKQKNAERTKPELERKKQGKEENRGGRKRKQGIREKGTDPGNMAARKHSKQANPREHFQPRRKRTQQRKRREEDKAEGERRKIIIGREDRP